MSDMMYSTMMWNDFLNNSVQQPASPPPGFSARTSPAPVSEPTAVEATEVKASERLDGKQLQLLSTVRVELSVEISRLQLSLGDLLELSSGTRLELQLQESLPVVLSIDSVPIAKGRIVFDGEEAAVEITELAAEEKIPGNNHAESGDQ